MFPSHDQNDLGSAGGTAVNRSSASTPVFLPTTWNVNSGTAITLTFHVVGKTDWLHKTQFHLFAMRTMLIGRWR